ncbi:inactive LRR receptor-like serine/threonine-protein kinase BIR2 [Humulus lupulus]|uniref:inactive LRR receptor-like serine/threonine-protein kinase BIR2 n=1 Tax=Humulus lupulus TaxID=3486 RepID=UPI002B415488|nr:inactive LRR receptor-like serine/threonine-protein kinase BIR2 [Humulus lupulus]
MKGLEAFLIWVTIFGLNFSGCYSKVSEDDVRCLQGIKQPFSDPAEKLSSWDFKNTSVGNICKFVGVTCWNDRENRVFNLEFRDMKLSGGNEFSGTIPSQICDWVPFITTLDMSNNSFSGSIPPELGKCSYLNELVLSNNQLSGTIPYEIASLGRLKVFYMESNLLSGEVPDFKSTYIIAQSYAENSQLFGRPLDPYHNINPLKVGFGIGYLV